jgi:hypothetical protein
MKNAYLFLTHKNSRQIFRLFNSLNDADATFVFHISKNAFPGFKEEMHSYFAKYKNVYFAKSENVIFCGWAFAQAILNVMEVLVKNNIDYDYAHLLSGQDYPIKSKTERDAFLTKNYGKNFIYSFQMYPETGSIYDENYIWGPTPQLYRLDRFNINLGKHVQPIPELESSRYLTNSFYALLKDYIKNYPQYKKEGKAKDELLIFLLTRILPSKRKLPGNFVYYGGRTWWTLTKEGVTTVINEHKNKPYYKRFYKYSLIPDEMYVHTLLGNSELKNTIIKDDLRHQEWDAEYHPLHPMPLTTNSFDRVKHSNALFARKFDNDTDPTVLDMIDKELLKLNS